MNTVKNSEIIRSIRPLKEIEQNILENWIKKLKFSIEAYAKEFGGLGNLPEDKRTNKIVDIFDAEANEDHGKYYISSSIYGDVLVFCLYYAYDYEEPYKIIQFPLEVLDDDPINLIYEK